MGEEVLRDDRGCGGGNGADVLTGQELDKEEEQGGEDLEEETEAKCKSGSEITFCKRYLTEEFG